MKPVTRPAAFLAFALAGAAYADTGVPDGFERDEKGHAAKTALISICTEDKDLQFVVPLKVSFNPAADGTTLKARIHAADLIVRQGLMILQEMAQDANERLRMLGGGGDVYFRHQVAAYAKGVNDISNAQIDYRFTGKLIFAKGCNTIGDMASYQAARKIYIEGLMGALTTRPHADSPWNRI